MFSISTWNTAARDTLSANSRKLPSPTPFSSPPRAPPLFRPFRAEGFKGRLNKVWTIFSQTLRVHLPMTSLTFLTLAQSPRGGRQAGRVLQPVRFSTSSLTRWHRSDADDVIFDLFYIASGKWSPLNFQGPASRKGGGTKALLKVAVSEILPYQFVLFNVCFDQRALRWLRQRWTLIRSAAFVS